jgi:hypothetical protein
MLRQCESAAPATFVEANHERASYTREAGLGFGHAWGRARDRALFGSVSPRDLSVRIRSGLKPGSAWNSRAHAGNRVVPSDCRPCKVVLERFSQRELASYSTYYSRSFPPPAFRERRHCRLACRLVAVCGVAMTDAPARPARGPNDYEVIADDWIVGRIVLSDASPAERPWLWSLDQEFYRDRTPG